MFAGINMFWARIRLILARAARLEQLGDLVSAKKSCEQWEGFAKFCVKKACVEGEMEGSLSARWMTCLGFR